MTKARDRDSTGRLNMAREPRYPLTSNNFFVPTDGLLLMAAGVITIDLSLSLTHEGLFRLLFLSILAFFGLLNLCFPGWKLSVNRIAFKSGASTTFLAASVVLLVLNFAALPANAQFMQNAQGWMESSFPDAGEVVPIVFNVLRALFILYVAIAVVKIINAAREDEDWKSLARTPLIVVIAVAVGDILAGLIVGNGGGSP